MNNILSKLLIVSLALCCIVAGASTVLFVKPAPAKVTIIKSAPVTTQYDTLFQFTLKCFDIEPTSKLSPARRDALADKIVRIVMREIPDDVQAEQTYIAALKIESNFDASAKSSVGATGLAQIMPSTFLEAADDCGFDVRKEDIANEDVNLVVGACYYQDLITENDNDAQLALLAYNGGSKTADKAKKFTNVNLESSNYGLKIARVQKLAKGDE